MVSLSNEMRSNPQNRCEIQKVQKKIEMGKLHRLCFVILFLPLLLGCATFKVKYSLKDVPKYTANYFSQHTLAVRMFEDHRAPDTARYSILKKGLTQEADAIMKDDEKWFINAEKHYKNGAVAPWVTQMTAKHIKAAGLFRDAFVAENGETISDYILEGEIEKFDAFKKSSVGAKIGASFGLIGTLATAGIKSDYDAETVLINLKLTNRRENKSIWTGKAAGKVSGHDYADPFGWAVYEKANESLKVAVNELTKELAETGSRLAV